MKKIFAILAVAVAMFTGCKKTSDFNNYIVKDYEYVKAQYPEQNVVFYEAQVRLNGSPAVLGKYTKPVSVKEVYQVVDTAIVVIINRDYEEQTYNVEVHDGYWCEDVIVDPYVVGDYSKALNTLLSPEVSKIPDAVLLTLRNPLGQVIYDNPFYIFGNTKTGFVAIDAVTFEVQTFDATESYLKSTEFPVIEQ